jgi:hypothetical protein
MNETAAAPTPPTSFRELRLAAGRTSTEVATFLKVKRGTVWRWDNGERPRWRHMQALATLLQIPSITDAVKQVWGEIIGEVCSCGCGGKKAPPQEQGAFSLAVDLPCIGCGKIRKYRKGWEHLHSRVLCNRCTAAKRKLERTPLKCVGYWFYTSHKRATNCSAHIDILRSRVKHWGRCAECKQRKCLCGTNRPRSIDDDSQRPFINLEMGLYRCQACYHSLQILKVAEEDVRNFWREIRPRSALPKIRSVPQLRNLQKKCYELAKLQGRQQASPKRIAYNPSFLDSKRSYKPGVPLGGSINRVKGSLVWRAKTSPDSSVKGLCQRCEKLIFSYRKNPRNLHNDCYVQYQREQHSLKIEVTPKLRSRGGQTTTGSLARNFSWAIRHYMGGEPYLSIGNGLDAKAVRKGINSILAYLPDPQLVGWKFRHRLWLLDEATKTRKLTRQAVDSA